MLSWIVLLVGILLLTIASFVISIHTQTTKQSQLTPGSIEFTLLSPQLQSLIENGTSSQQSLQEQINIINTQIATLQNNNQNLQSQITILNSDVTVIQTQITNIQTQITTIQNQITAIQTAISPADGSWYQSGSDDIPLSAGTPTLITFASAQQGVHNHFTMPTPGVLRFDGLIPGRDFRVTYNVTFVMPGGGSLATLSFWNSVNSSLVVSSTTAVVIQAENASIEGLQWTVNVSDLVNLSTAGTFQLAVLCSSSVTLNFTNCSCILTS